MRLIEVCTGCGSGFSREGYSRLKPLPQIQNSAGRNNSIHQQAGTAGTADGLSLLVPGLQHISELVRSAVLSPQGYNQTMYSVIETQDFIAWLDGLRDMPTRVRLRRRLSKATRGILGDVKPVGDGVWEMREFFGPGWRMYYIVQGTVVIMMLGGGDKSSQGSDIERAKALALELQHEQDQDPAV